MRIGWFVLLMGLSCLGIGESSAATIYTYDTLGRLSTVCYDNGMKIIYTYDPAGNRTQVVTQGATC
jgi:uncharacterized protein RhaS with RHS repeats